MRVVIYYRFIDDMPVIEKSTYQNSGHMDAFFFYPNGAYKRIVLFPWLFLFHI